MSRQHPFTSSDIAELLTEPDPTVLFAAANELRMQICRPDVVTYSVDPIVNYTNVCTARCSFCAFYRPPSHEEGYVLSPEALSLKIEASLTLGATGILLQGGLHPELPLEWYETLLQRIKQSYAIHLHCFSAPEILNISRVSATTVDDVLRKLRDSGMDSLPGAGAEILHDDVRRAISPLKCTSSEWLNVHRSAHKLGIPSTATMMFGCGESPAHLHAHLEAIRCLQEDTGGFTAFIPWPFQPRHTVLGRYITKTSPAATYFRIIALSRLFLLNVPNIQVSWPTMGVDTAASALKVGANDFGSLLVEEHVLSAAGTRQCATRVSIKAAIKAAGYRALQRDALYRHFFDDSSDSIPLIGPAKDDTGHP